MTAHRPSADHPFRYRSVRDAPTEPAIGAGSSPDLRRGRQRLRRGPTTSTGRPSKGHLAVGGASKAEPPQTSIAGPDPDCMTRTVRHALPCLPTGWPDSVPFVLGDRVSSAAQHCRVYPSNHRGGSRWARRTPYRRSLGGKRWTRRHNQIPGMTTVPRLEALERVTFGREHDKVVSGRGPPFHPPPCLRGVAYARLRAASVRGASGGRGSRSHRVR